eukprot:TRINITY_DN8012_c0_g1_i1.p1 TRINITY_DN8012_c0_g1~~TRINITY_DN8012_c0_g1_i1.p1  ORF type:complete len:85 (+),score=24.81 TRINITY_DN8012_c0_g1_i1:142-396(+)
MNPRLKALQETPLEPTENEPQTITPPPTKEVLSFSGKLNENGTEILHNRKIETELVKAMDILQMEIRFADLGKKIGPEFFGPLV